MKLIVTDTNIFIDLINIGGLPEFFRLPFEIHTTSFVINELNEKQKLTLFEVSANKLFLKKFDEDEVTEVVLLEIKNAGLSFQDKSVLYYSGKVNAILVSGDKDLREEAANKGIEAHGLIWALEQCISLNVLSVKKAIDLLDKWLETNKWLKPDLIKETKANWSKKFK